MGISNTKPAPPPPSEQAPSPPVRLDWGKGKQQHLSSPAKPHRYRGSTIHRIPTCKEREKCPSIKRIQHKHYSISDLNHLTEYSHPRKICATGIDCIHVQKIMKGSYDIADLCHTCVYLHPSSRFITSFSASDRGVNKKVPLVDDKSKSNSNENDSNSKTHYPHESSSSLQVPRTGAKDGIESYKRIGIMICDGGCGSPITRGLWKCWCFRDLIWNYKYRRYRKSKDPYHTQKKLDGSYNYNDDDEMEKKDISRALITMIESVIALAGESFLQEMNDLISIAKRVRSAKKETNISADLKKEIANVMATRDKHELAYGDLLFEFSESARKEFGFPNNEYPVIRKGKQWQNPSVYGVLLGIVNSRLKVAPVDLDNPTASSEITTTTIANTGAIGQLSEDRNKRSKTKQKTAKRNLRQELFSVGCRNANRDLFRELGANGFEYVLSIPRSKSTMYSTPDNKEAGAQGATDTIASPNFINPDWTSLQGVAREKLHHPRHVEMGSCLEEEELLSVLLLTGTTVGLDLIESHRKYRNYCKWRTLQNNLMSALTKLCTNDRTPLPNQFFHGLKRGPKNANKFSSDEIYLFNTFVSTTLDHRLIESSFADRKDGALLFLDRREPIVCADISWISKFPFEHEVLFAPCALTLPSPFSNKKGGGRGRGHSRRKSKHKDRRSRHSRGSRKEKSSKHRSSRSGRDKDAKRRSSGKIDKLKQMDRAALAGDPTVSSNAKSEAYERHHRQGFDKDRAPSLADLSASRAHANTTTSLASGAPSHRTLPSFARDARSGNLNFSLVDGRLEAFSIDSTVSQSIGSSMLLHSPMQSLRSDNPSARNSLGSGGGGGNGGEPKKTDEVISAQLKNVDINWVADFLYGKTTPELLWSHLDPNQMGTITNETLRQLFFALFVFAIQLEATNANVRSYLPQCQKQASEYAAKFAEGISNDIGSNNVTREYFVNNAYTLHDLYDQFLENMLQELGNEEEDEAGGNDHEQKRGDGMSTIEEVEATATGASEAGLAQALGKKAEDERSLVSNVEAIRNFCKQARTLKQLWLHFTGVADTSDTEPQLMNYIQFDVLVYAALAYFVQQRNPEAPLATRQSLDPLIDQLRISLLAAYDPDCKGFVSFESFQSFGDYLLAEYRKLRGSLAVDDSNLPSATMESEAQQVAQEAEDYYYEDEYEDEYEDDEDEDEFSDEDADEDEKQSHLSSQQTAGGGGGGDSSQASSAVSSTLAKPRNSQQDVVGILEAMKTEVDGFIKILTNNVKQLCDGIEGKVKINIGEYFETIRTQIEHIAAHTKEMEIQCNQLKNQTARYKYAQIINELDMQREHLQATVSSVMVAQRWK